MSLNFYLRLLLAALAAFRLAELIAFDNGPFFVFQRTRSGIERYIARDKRRNESWFWRSVADGVNCPYCLGVYVGVLCLWLVMRPNRWKDLVLLYGGIVGGQAVLQGVAGRE